MRQHHPSPGLNLYRPKYSDVMPSNEAQTFSTCEECTTAIKILTSGQLIGLPLLTWPFEELGDLPIGDDEDDHDRIVLQHRQVLPTDFLRSSNCDLCGPLRPCPNNTTTIFWLAVYPENGLIFLLECQLRTIATVDFQENNRRHSLAVRVSYGGFLRVRSNGCTFLLKTDIL
jgi:hypothetical protein